MRAISVASKALVFGALALGAYLLPEATIRWNEGGHAVRQLGVTLIFLAVPAAVLLGISLLVVPRWFLTLVFSAKLSSAAPAFATLVVAMMCLCFSVLVTNYLFGTGSRWIVFLLLAGASLAVVLVALAGGRTTATARADLVAQAALAAAMAVAFVLIHSQHRGQLVVSAPSRRRMRHRAGSGVDATRQPSRLAETLATTSGPTVNESGAGSRRQDGEMGTGGLDTVGARRS